MKPILTLLTALLLAPLIVLNAEDIAPLKQARASDPTTAFDWKGLNTQAAEECLTPVHPGKPGQVPFWNAYATQFTYVPAFDFPEVAHAARYRFEAADLNSGKVYSHEQTKPWAPIVGLWSQMPPSAYQLTVTARAESGEVIRVVGQRVFVRRPAFHGPYTPAAKSYRRCAQAALKNVFDQPYVRKLAEKHTADVADYVHYCYPSKTLAAIIQAMCLHAQLAPADRDEALRIACAAADILIATSSPPDAGLPGFPMTYQGEVAAAKGRGHLIMMNYPLEVALAFMRLHDATRQQKYHSAAVRLMDAYARLQRPDGGWLLLYDWRTGKAIGDHTLIALDFLHIADRLDAQGIGRFMPNCQRTFDAMMKDRVTSFNWNGQFEDVEPKKDYENLAKDMAGAFARYLLGGSRTKSEVLSIAEMIARYIEDQFVLWSPVRVPKEHVKVLRHDFLTGKEVYPLAQEQYSYMRPINGSAADALWTFTAVARATGNRLWLAKACALGDVMTRTQCPDGELPTYWDDLSIHSTWLNCQVFCAQALLELAIASEVPGPNPKGKP